MIIENLKLQNYRNIGECFYEPDRGVNVIYGDNALGKTNLLESIWMFTGFKSFRGTRDSGLIKFGESYARNEMNFVNVNRDMNEVLLIDGKRQALLNGVRVENMAELVGSFCSVIFSPNHLSLVKGMPQERRKFLDSAICQLRPGYAKILSDYSKILRQRNVVLKNRENGNLKTALEIYDLQLSEAARKISNVRYEFTDEFFECATGIYKGISSDKEDIKMRYVTALPKNFQDGGTYEEMYALTHEEDIEAGYTKYGPHRDDIEIIIDKKSARLYGSQGQQRSAALSLKLAEAQMIEKITGEKPVILLDDVMSELDAGRQDYLLNRLGESQVFITCCEPGTLLRMKCGKAVKITECFT